MTTRTPETPAFQAYQMYYIQETFGEEALLDVLEESPAVAEGGERLSGRPGGPVRVGRPLSGRVRPRGGGAPRGGGHLREVLRV